MKRRDVKIGMTVKHRHSGKPLGSVVGVGSVLVHLDGECPIATPAELSPDSQQRP